MNTKVTLSFEQSVIENAKVFAKQHNISLSRLCEFLLRKTTEKGYASLEDLPVSDWVQMVAEGKAEYKTRSRKSTKQDFRERK
ncbi:MAG: hypothetical protein KDC92_07780 [Bacteroidetes bacterium]|nr:hypothetical protein [Bacteroidota bacterium]